MGFLSRVRKKYEKRSEPRIQFPVHRFKLLDIHLTELRTQEHLRGRALLHDLSPKGVSIFSERFIAPEEKIELAIFLGEDLVITGQVVWCNESGSTSKVIREVNACRYRVGIKFEFDSPRNQKTLVDYCNKLRSADVPISPA